MKYLGIIYSFIFFYFLNLKVEAQIDLFPKHFSQVLLAKQLQNPAFANLNQSNNVILGNRFYTGSFSKINNFYFLGNIKLNRKDSMTYAQNIGIKFMNEKEGEFVERSKYYLSYSIRRKIFYAYWLGLGIDLGRAGYLFKGTDISTAGSDSNWDGSFGTVLNNDNNYIGFGINQVFNSIVQPKNLRFRWGRFYSLYVEKRIHIGNHEISIYGQNQFIKSQKNVLDVGTNLCISKIFCIGSNLWVGRSFGFLLGLKDINLNAHHISFYMNYNTNILKQNTTNVQSFELSVNYCFKKINNPEIE